MLNTPTNLPETNCPITLVSGLDTKHRRALFEHFTKRSPRPLGEVSAGHVRLDGTSLGTLASGSCCSQHTTRIPSSVLSVAPVGYSPWATVTDAVLSLVRAGAGSVIVELDREASPLQSARSLIEGCSASSGIAVVEVATAIDARDVAALRSGKEHHHHDDPALESQAVTRLIEQLETASLVVVSGTETEVDATRPWIAALNPLARCFRASGMAWPASTTKTTLEAFRERAGWLKALDEQDNSEGPWRVYRAWRPFHPERFQALLESGGWLGVERSAGFCWLATQMRRVGRWSQMGGFASLQPAGHWWANRLAPGEYQAPPELPSRLVEHWREPFGDRRQALVLLPGRGVDIAPLFAALDACLLSDEEMALGQLGWRYLADPIPDLCWRSAV